MMTAPGRTAYGRMIASPVNSQTSRLKPKTGGRFKLQSLFSDRIPTDFANSEAILVKTLQCGIYFLDQETLAAANCEFHVSVQLLDRLIRRIGIPSFFFPQFLECIICGFLQIVKLLHQQGSKSVAPLFYFFIRRTNARGDAFCTYFVTGILRTNESWMKQWNHSCKHLILFEYLLKLQYLSIIFNTKGIHSYIHIDKWY